MWTRRLVNILLSFEPVYAFLQEGWVKRKLLTYIESFYRMNEHTVSWVSYDRVNWAQITETFKLNATDRLPLLFFVKLPTNWYVTLMTVCSFVMTLQYTLWWFVSFFLIYLGSQLNATALLIYLSNAKKKKIFHAHSNFKLNRVTMVVKLEWIEWMNERWRRSKKRSIENWLTYSGQFIIKKLDLLLFRMNVMWSL